MNTKAIKIWCGFHSDFFTFKMTKHHFYELDESSRNSPMVYSLNQEPGPGPGPGL